VDTGKLAGTGAYCQQHHAVGEHLDGGGKHRVARQGEPVAQD
jgi:hypothetical protein